MRASAAATAQQSGTPLRARASASSDETSQAHCEEEHDDAIQPFFAALDRAGALLLATTGLIAARHLLRLRAHWRISRRSRHA
jgi:hypothetical protein